jgi:hypothetical protein
LSLQDFFYLQIFLPTEFQVEVLPKFFLVFGWFQLFTIFIKVQFVKQHIHSQNMLSRKLLVQPVRSIIRPNTQALRAASTVDQSSLLKFAWTPRALSLYEAHMEFKKFAEENFATVKEKVVSFPSSVVRNMQVAAEESLRDFMGSPRDLLLYESHLHYNDFIQENFRAGDMSP